MGEIPGRLVLKNLAGRSGLLRLLANGVSDKRRFESELNRTRSTINRWLDQLEQDRFVDQTGDPTLTLTGRLAMDEYDRFNRSAAAILAAEPLLRYLPTDCEIDLRLLAGAEILRSSSIAPEAPVGRLEDLLLTSTARHCTATTPIILPRYVTFFHDQIVAGTLTVEFILQPAVYDYLWTAHADELESVLEAVRDVDCRLTDRELPFGLVLVDTEYVWVVVHDHGGALRGAIVNDSEAAIEWGQERIAALKAASMAGPLPDLRTNPSKPVD